MLKGNINKGYADDPKEILDEDGGQKVLYHNSRNYKKNVGKYHNLGPHPHELLVSEGHADAVGKKIGGKQVINEDKRSSVVDAVFVVMKKYRDKQIDDHKKNPDMVSQIERYVVGALPEINIDIENGVDVHQVIET